MVVPRMHDQKAEEDFHTVHAGDGGHGGKAARHGPAPGAALLLRCEAGPRGSGHDGTGKPLHRHTPATLITHFKLSYQKLLAVISL